MKKFNLLILISVVIVVSIALSFILKNRQNKQSVVENKSETETAYKIFKSSEAMSFTVKIPQHYQISEKLTSVSLNSASGDVIIIRNGTNFSKLDDYIAEFDSRRNLNFSESKKLIINGLESLSRTVYYPDEKVTKKSVYIYSDNSVYILSTEKVTLYSDLDQIAQSFRYAP